MRLGQGDTGDIAPGAIISYEFVVHDRPHSLELATVPLSIHLQYNLLADGLALYDGWRYATNGSTSIGPTRADPGSPNPSSPFIRNIHYPFGEVLATQQVLAGPDLYRDQLGTVLGSSQATYYPDPTPITLQFTNAGAVPASVSWTLDTSGEYQPTTDEFWPEPISGHCLPVPRPRQLTDGVIAATPAPSGSKRHGRPVHGSVAL